MIRSNPMKRYAGPALAFFFPLVYFFRFIYPDTSFLVLENDFGWLYYVYKGYLTDSIAHGHFPLWSPAEAGGYGFFGNPFAAPLYPLNVVPIAVRLLAGNYNQWFHQIYTVLGVSIFALGMWRWLHQVFRNPIAATFTSVTLSACWSMGEFMRFPNAIHAIAWVPWVLAAMHAAHRSARIAPVLAGMAALVCQITAGYPYFVVYSFLLYGAYAIYLLWVDAQENWKDVAIRQAFLVGTPVLLTLPYTYAVSQLMKVTTDRAGGDFGYATEYQFGPLDLLGSLVFPPVSTVEGCFYGGILTVFILILYFWRSRETREKVGVLIGLLAFLAVIMNHRSYFFTPIWSFVPILNQMRVFSRMTIILLPILAIAIHQGFAIFSDELSKGESERVISARMVCLAFGAVLMVQLVLYFFKDSLNHEFMSLHGRLFPGGPHELDFLMYTIVTMVAVLIVLNVDWAKLRHGREITLAILLVIVTLDAGNQGRYLWTKPLPTVLSENGVDTSRGFKKAAWEFAKRQATFWHLVADYFTLDRLSDAPALSSGGLRKAPMANFDYQTYTRFYQATAPAKVELDQIMGKEKLFFHGALHDGLHEFLVDAASHDKGASPPDVEYFDGNELKLEITTFEPGYLSWIDNFDAGWSAEVDGQVASIERVMGTFKSIELRGTGKHVVRFVYRPVIAAGAYVCLVAGLVAPGLLLLWNRRRQDRRESVPTQSSRAA